MPDSQCDKGTEASQKNQMATIYDVGQNEGWLYSKSSLHSRSEAFVMVRVHCAGTADAFPSIPFRPLLNPPAKGRQGASKAHCVTP